MTENDLIILLEVNDRIIVENIQQILEESGIFSLMASDNPASSLLNIYSGLNPFENILIKVHKDDYQRAVEIINNIQYHS